MVHWTDRDTVVLTSSPNVVVAWSRLPAFSWMAVISKARTLHVGWLYPPTIRRWQHTRSGLVHLNRVQRASVATLRPKDKQSFSII